MQKGINMRDENKLIADKIYPNAVVVLVRSPIARDWMDESGHRFAQQCLTTVLTNPSDWIQRTIGAIGVHWFGGPKKQMSELRARESGLRIVRLATLVLDSLPLQFSFCFELQRESTFD